MKLYEVVYREITDMFLKGKNTFTQKELSEKLEISIGNINKSIKKLESINAVKIEARSFSIIALDKVMLYWATHRTLDRDIVYKGFSDLTINEIEASMPNGIAFTAYTAYKKSFRSIPAEYSEIYLYATEDAIENIKKRFPKQSKFPNIFVLKADKTLSYKILNEKVNSVPIPNVFVDLWNIRTWYAKEFVDILSKKLFG
jgi:hypothetical protein